MHGTLAGPGHFFQSPKVLLVNDGLYERVVVLEHLRDERTGRQLSATVRARAGSQTIRACSGSRAFCICSVVRLAGGGAAILLGLLLQPLSWPPYQRYNQSKMIIQGTQGEN